MISELNPKINTFINLINTIGMRKKSNVSEDITVLSKLKHALIFIRLLRISVKLLYALYELLHMVYMKLRKTYFNRLHEKRYQFTPIEVLILLFCIYIVYIYNILHTLQKFVTFYFFFFF